MGKLYKKEPPEAYSNGWVKVIRLELALYNPKLVGLKLYFICCFGHCLSTANSFQLTLASGCETIHRENHQSTSYFLPILN